MSKNGKAKNGKDSKKDNLFAQLLSPLKKEKYLESNEVDLYKYSDASDEGEASNVKFDEILQQGGFVPNAVADDEIQEDYEPDMAHLKWEEEIDTDEKWVVPERARSEYVQVGNAIFDKETGEKIADKKVMPTIQLAASEFDGSLSIDNTPIAKPAIAPSQAQQLIFSVVKGFKEVTKRDASTGKKIDKKKRSFWRKTS